MSRFPGACLILCAIVTSPLEAQSHASTPIASRIRLIPVNSNTKAMDGVPVDLGVAMRLDF